MRTWCNTAGWCRAGVVCLALLTAACGSATPYAPADDSGYGFAEQRIENDRFRVTFAGNSLTPRADVETFMLYRAAELTVQNGYDYFAIADRDTERNTYYYGTGVGAGRFYGSRFGGYTGLSTGDLAPVDSYRAIVDIRMFEGERPDNAFDSYDAREVLQNLAGRIVRPDGTTAG